MKQIELSDITQDVFDSAVQIVAAGVKAYNRKLDVRAGTVLRDLLVNPEAALESVAYEQMAEVRGSTSLKRLKEAQDNGVEVDQDDVSAILSNFNLRPAQGLKARGTVKVVVSDGTIAYSVAAGSAFSTVDGLRFVADVDIVAASFEVVNASVAEVSKLHEGTAGYFFLVPVTAEEPGSAGNVQQGTSLTPESSISSFVMAEAYKDFDGGSDTPSIGAVIDSIPSGLSIRGFVNKTAVEGMLRDRFDSGDFPMVAVSAVGYGNAAQRRDRHNLFGVGVGGRVDVYVRNFGDLFTKTAILEGAPGASDGEYVISAPPGTFPGACWIKSVSDPFRDVDGEAVVSSFAFEANRTADVSGSWHDIDLSSGPAEAFNTVWQGFTIKLSEVPLPEDSGDSAGSGGSRSFKVTAWCLPQAEDLQSYVDRDDVRSIATDVVVRCPVICSVSVNAVVQYDPKKPMDLDAARSRIRSYINSLGFVGRLTRSEIVYVLKELGAISVDMPNKDMLYGSLHDAFGVRHVLSGDALDISTIADGAAMLSKDTVVFAAEDRNIQIKAIPNS